VIYQELVNKTTLKKNLTHNKIHFLYLVLPQIIMKEKLKKYLF